MATILAGAIQSIYNRQRDMWLNFVPNKSYFSVMLF